MKNPLKPTTLDINFSELFIGEEVKIGSTNVMIVPLSLFKYAIISKKIQGFISALKEREVTLDNIQTPENLIIVAEVLLDKFPELLETITDIAVESLQQLPIDIVVELLTVAIEVNLKSKDTLVGNFKNLAKQVTSLLPGTEEEESKE